MDKEQKCRKCKGVGCSRGAELTNGFCNHCQPSPKAQGWEEGFDKLCDYWFLEGEIVEQEGLKQLRDFIQTQIAQAKKERTREIIEKIEGSLWGASLINDDTLLVRVDISELIDEFRAKYLKEEL